MSEATLALHGATFPGIATIREIGPLGMIGLRAKGLAALPKAVKAVTGAKLPALRRIETAGDKVCAWMSPDEYLILVPQAEVAQALATLERSLAGEHHLAVDLSDARAVFRIEGPRAAEVIAKLCPVDIDRLPQGEVRRTRAAQVACALWRDETGVTLVAFRSVARYVFDLLANAARD